MNVEDRIEESFPPSWIQLAKLIDRVIRTKYPEYTIDQIKSKFGGMRYYFSIPEHEEFDIEFALLIDGLADLSYLMD